MSEIIYIETARLVPHEKNPRKDLGDLTELAESIRSMGVLQNLVVVPYGGDKPLYTIVAGHRRHAAARLAGLDKLPCVVREMEPMEQLGVMLMENIQRNELTIQEQALGFQLMIDLGESVEGLAARTGFSPSTVRRRLKLAELDQDKLAKASARQISIKDMDRLARVEDVKARNRLLDSIGTTSFEFNCQTELRKQLIRERLPGAKTELRESSLKELDVSKWSSNVERLDGVKLEGLEPGESCIPEGLPEGAMWDLDEDWGRVEFYAKKPKKAPVQRPPEEIQREKEIKAAWETLETLGDVAHICRKRFAESLTVTEKTRQMILDGAMLALLVQTVSFVPTDNEEIRRLTGTGKVEYSQRAGAAKREYMDKRLGNLTPCLILAALGDVEGAGLFAQGPRTRWPQHRESDALDYLYTWLAIMGYAVSDEEQQLIDGTHPAFRDPEEVEK